MQKAHSPRLHPSSDSPHNTTTRAARSRKARSWLLGLSACLLPVVAARAQSSVEYSYLRTMDTTVLANNTGGVPDSYGMVGANKPTGVGLATPFQVDEQRGAFDSMVTGIALYGRGAISDSLCDLYVSRGMSALAGAYNLQTPDGDFYSTVTENSDGSVTGGGGGNGCDNMKFFMAYSEHALLLLANNAHYNSLYSAQIVTLMPKIARTLDFFCASGHGFSQGSGTGSAKTSKGAPNRDLVCACANGLGHLFLSGYTGQTNWSKTNYDAGNYMIEADKWLDNYMIIAFQVSNRLYSRLISQVLVTRGAWTWKLFSANPGFCAL